MLSPINDVFDSAPDWILGYKNNALVNVPVFKGPGGVLPAGTGFGQGAGGGGGGTDLTGVLASIAGLTTITTNQGNSITTLQTNVSTLQSTTAGLTTSYGTLNTTVTGHTTSINTLLAASGYEETIIGLVGDGTTDNWAVFQSYLGPAEDSGLIVASGAVNSRVPDYGFYVVNKHLDVDPQNSMYWNARGAITMIPGPSLPGVTLGAANQAIRTGGGAPGALMRIVRRAPGLNKQAFEPIIGGWNIDASAVRLWDNFTSDATGLFTSAHAHQRSVGDMIFFDQLLGASLPTPLVAGDHSYTTAYYVKTVPSSTTFTVATTVGGSQIVTAVGTGVWTTDVYGIRVPNNQNAGVNANDPDQAWDTKKTYTAGTIHDMDVIGMSASGLLTEAGNGRLHIHSARFLGNRLNGIEASSNDKVFSGHWAAGGNGLFGVKLGSATGIYATTGNIWGAPANRSVNCGAVWMRDTAFWCWVANEFNDWVRMDGINNFNNAGVFSGNMMHPHAENFSADGVAINVLNDGDVRLQSNVGIQGYQGVNLFGNAWSRTEKTSFNKTYGNFLGTTDGSTGTAPQYLISFGAYGGRPAGAQVFDGVFTGPDVKPWQGPFSTVTITIAAPGVITWTGHPLQVGDRVFFHTNGALPTGLTGDTVNYYVSNVIDANTFSVSATYGGASITTTGSQSGTHTLYWLSSSPYSLAGNAFVAGVYVDSYRGVVNLWQANGIAPKFMIGTAKGGVWEGNPNYIVEIGDVSLAGGLPKHNMLYGAWEADFAYGWRTATLNRSTIDATHTSKTIAAYVAQQYYVVSTGSPPASATLTLPQTMKSSYDMTIIIAGAIPAITWTATLNTNSPPLPTFTTGWTTIQIEYLADNDEWNVVSVGGIGAQGWTTLTDAATINTPALVSGDGKFYVTLAGNRTLANPTNPKDGARYKYRIIQDATGSRTLAYGGKFKFPGGTPTLTTTAAAVDIIDGVYDAAANAGAGILWCTIGKAYA